MRWIGRFFLVIALIFLALDITDPIAEAPEAGAAAPAAGGAAAGETGAGTSTGGEITAGETATGGTAGDGASSGDGAAGATTGDGTGSAAPAADGPNRVMLHTLGERWFEYHPDSYLQISPAVSRHVSAWLDDSIVQPLMLQPAFLIFFALWLIFSFFSWLIGRSRSRYDDDEDW